MNIFKYFIILFLVLLNSCLGSNDVSFKSNINIQIDGLFNQEDWDEATIVNFTPSTTLYFIQNEVDLFLGISNKDGINRYIDLYIANDSTGTINLHASMQLGERLLGDNWNDTIPAWNWGNNSHWVSNSVELINHSENSSFRESVEPYEGFEFKISKIKIKSKEVRIRIELKDFEGQASAIIFPLNSERMKQENWHGLLLK